MIDEATSYCLKNPGSVVHLIGKRNYFPSGESRREFTNGSVLYTARKTLGLKKSYADCIFLDSDEPLPDFLAKSEVTEI